MRKTVIYALGIGQYFLTICLTALQFIDSDTGYKINFAGRLFAYIYDKRLWIAVILALLLGIFEILKKFLSSTHKLTKHIRQTIMQAMLDECFQGDAINFRITIFKKTGFWRTLWIYITRLWCEFNWRSIQYSYVRVWERAGKPQKSGTYFRYDPDKEANCRGIAGIVMYRGLDVIVERLPNIEHIDITNVPLKDKGKETHQATLIRKYAKESYLKIADLRKIKRKTRHVYGNVLNNELGEFKGVLIIDSCEEQSPFTDDVLKNIPYYLKIIASTL